MVAGSIPAAPTNRGSPEFRGAAASPMRYALCLLILCAACSEEPVPGPTPLESEVYDLQGILGDSADSSRPAPEDIVPLIRNQVAQSYWDSSPGSSIRLLGEPYRLKVIATPAVQREIAALLDRIREGG